jgi:hypothetical protein
MFSSAAVQIIGAYIRSFPIVFAALESMGEGESSLSPDDIGGIPVAERVVKWLTQLECMTIGLVPFSTKTMSMAAIGAVETASDVILKRLNDRCCSAAVVATAATTATAAAIAAAIAAAVVSVVVAAAAAAVLDSWPAHPACRFV